MADRVVLITGASSGIGAATARRLARPGMAFLLHARGGTDGGKRPALEALAGEAADKGAETEVRFSDLSDGGGADLVAAAVERFGRLDQIVSNAGYALPKPIGQVDREALNDSHEVMVGTFFDLIGAGLPYLKVSDCGRVVAVSSFVAHQAPGGRVFPVTAAAKGAMEALVRSFAAQVARDGVTVNCVAPGFTRKETSGHSALSDEAWRAAADMTPSGRLGEPSDVAAAIAFFLSEDAAHITGQTLHVDGGLMLN
jgi:NAD(P)-dependent dehydrogenase (short-subunit alcohol dehydrogenase family)